jgi:SNF2 family DNA or RNA helicase
MAVKKLPPPWKHQKQTLTKGKKTPEFFDMSDPGTGKTRPAIERVANFSGRTLVIAVKSNLDVVWKKEIQQWVPGMVPVVANADNRSEAFKAHYADVIITNIDAVNWIQAQGAAYFKKLGITDLVFDESTHFKNASSKRSKAALWIRKQPSIKRVELMSGTPNPLSITEIWHQMMLCDLGQRLGQSYYRFRETVCQPEQIRVPGGRTITKWHDLKDAEEAVFGILSPISIRHEFEQCVDVPENVLSYLDVPLTPKLRAEYDLLERTSLIEHATNPIVGTNAAVLYGKLLQLCSGAVYGVDGHRVFDRSRYELVADLVDERPHSSISFFLWQHQKECIAEELKKRKINYAVLDGTVTQKDARKNIVNDFQAGKIKHLIIHPKTGAHGLTLTTGRTAIWASPVPSPELFKQGGHRIYRGGQTHKTETICLRAPRTIEELVYESMFGRKIRMDNFLNLIAEASQ